MTPSGQQHSVESLDRQYLGRIRELVSIATTLVGEHGRLGYASHAIVETLGRAARLVDEAALRQALEEVIRERDENGNERDAWRERVVGIGSELDAAEARVESLEAQLREAREIATKYRYDLILLASYTGRDITVESLPWWKSPVSAPEKEDE